MSWFLSTQNAANAADAPDLFADALSREAVGKNHFAALTVFAELVGNVVKHAPGPLHAGFQVTQDEARLRVRDCGNGFSLQPQLPPDPLRENGRGLFIVRSLCKWVGVQRDQRGTTVSAVVSLAD